MIAETFCRRFQRMMVISAGISLACSLGGLMLSAVVNVPCSALIVMVMVGAYILARLVTSFHSR